MFSSIYRGTTWSHWTFSSIIYNSETKAYVILILSRRFIAENMAKIKYQVYFTKRFEHNQLIKSVKTDRLINFGLSNYEFKFCVDEHDARCIFTNKLEELSVYDLVEILFTRKSCGQGAPPWWNIKQRNVPARLRFRPKACRCRNELTLID